MRTGAETHNIQTMKTTSIFQPALRQANLAGAGDLALPEAEAHLAICG